MATNAVAGTFVDNEPRIDLAHADGTVSFSSAWIECRNGLGMWKAVSMLFQLSLVKVLMTATPLVNGTSLFVMTDRPPEDAEDVGHGTAKEMPELLLDCDKLGVRQYSTLISGGSKLRCLRLSTVKLEPH